MHHRRDVDQQWMPRLKPEQRYPFALCSLPMGMTRHCVVILTAHARTTRTADQDATRADAGHSVFKPGTLSTETRVSRGSTPTLQSSHSSRCST